MLLWPKRTPTAGIVTSMMLMTAVAATTPVTDAPAQGHANRTGMVQHAAPIQRAAPFQHPGVLRSAPVQHLAPRVIMPTAMPRVVNPGGPAHVMPTFAQPGTQPGSSNNFQFANPHLQGVHPGLPFNGPSALRPNVPLNHPTGLRPNFPNSNPNELKPAPAIENANTLKPNLSSEASVKFVQPNSGASPQGPTALKPGPSKADFNRPLLTPNAGNREPIKTAFPAVNLHGKIWPISKDSKFMWIAGHRKRFISVNLLGVVLIGGSFWYPDSYVSMQGPACTGFTPDGCQLQWRMVDFDDGGGEPQCVQYCPQVSFPPEQVGSLPQEQQAATLPPPPPLSANGVCQTTIYSEPNFSGNSAPTSDSQPTLSETGWRNEISSIVVGAGTWDFFIGENYEGESVRLPPGTYPTLSAEWTKRIGSFMCTEPGSPPA